MQISILGAGWLGKPLAMALHSQGHRLKVSKRQDMTPFDPAIPIYPYDLYTSPPSAIVPFENSELVIINIPGGRKSTDLSDYTGAMCDLVSRLKQQGCQHLLHVSSTSVYGECTGIVTEDTQVQPATPSAEANLAIEQHCRHVFTNGATILRLAGLVDHQRHPVNFLAGKRLTNGQQAVNLIHKDDVITAISAVIQRRLWGNTLHLCSTEHPTRKDYYQWAAKQKGLPLPEFDQQYNQTGRQIDAQATLGTLGITLAYPSPYAMI